MEERIYKKGKLIYERTKDGEIRKYNKRGNLYYKENEESSKIYILDSIKDIEDIYSIYRE